MKINIDRFSHISIKPQHVYLYFEATLPLRQLWIWNLQELEIESLVKVLTDKFINFQVVNNTGIEMILLRVVRVRRFLHIYIYIFDAGDANDAGESDGLSSGFGMKTTCIYSGSSILTCLALKRDDEK